MALGLEKFILGLQRIFQAVTGGPVEPTNGLLYEDNSFVLLEDGGYLLQEA